MNVTLGLSCQRDADRNLTDTVAHDAKHRTNKKATLSKVTRITKTCTFLQKSQSKNLLLIYHKFTAVSIPNFGEISLQN